HPWKIVPASLMVFQLRRMLGLRGKGVTAASRIGVPVNLFDAMRVVLHRTPSGLVRPRRVREFGGSQAEPGTFSGVRHLSVSRSRKGQMVFRAQVYLVIPAYNEGPVISRVVAEVKRAGHAVVVVDDGSIDATAEHARAGGAAVITHPFNLGQGAALQTGIDYPLARAAEFIVTFDADGQHRVSDISRLVEALVQERADFALGSRFLGQAPNLPPLRRLLLRAATLFTRLTTGLQVTDTHN